MSLAVKHDDGAAVRVHVPVMAGEVRELLCAHGPRVVVDATVGTGGHALQILGSSQARLIGIDRDSGALEIARQRLASYGDRVLLCQGDFAAIASILAQCGVERADSILADLGMSSFALDDPERGFSFRADGPLDMRMDRTQKLRAYDLVNEETETDLADILHHLGEERAARRIARAIVDARRRRPIETTAELRAIVERVLGPRRGGGVHPATRTVQALRIAVNREMDGGHLGPFTGGPGSQGTDAPIGARGRVCPRQPQGDSRKRPGGRIQSPRAQRAAALHREGCAMNRRVRPTKPPSKLLPAILMIALAIVGFATLMVRLEITREGYRLSALNQEIVRLADQNRTLELRAAELSSHERLRSLAPNSHLAPPARGQVVLVP